MNSSVLNMFDDGSYDVVLAVVDAINLNFLGVLDKLRDYDRIFPRNFGSQLQVIFQFIFGVGNPHGRT